MASGKPYVFRPLHPGFVIKLVQTAYKAYMTERQYIVFIGSVCVGGGCRQFYCIMQKAHQKFCCASVSTIQVFVHHKVYQCKYN